MKVNDCELRFLDGKKAPGEYCDVWKYISECFAETGCNSSEFTCNEAISDIDDSFCSSSCLPSKIEACEAERTYFMSTFYVACASGACSKIVYAGVIWTITVMFTVTWM
eukprot:gnl/TRDRNA2_/TRDRNA2_75176_c0_seq1.p1 gnl/TRDRNA2_/TRDRNA2_75176_c0~~gnl/TRDRNA2_/TRDRNA2_75176_c0_seq1.p1  ORF type:complete len:118 (-),score=16.83 gnl/TRDRNA2_/TRDRNA2_75176_c0_seq1:76-402(-)